MLSTVLMKSILCKNNGVEVPCIVAYFVLVEYTVPAHPNLPLRF